MVASIPNGAAISCIGESSADEGAVTGRYFGVMGSVACGEMNEVSFPSMGKVWLLGRWKLLPCGGMRDCWEGIQVPEFVSGENVNGVVGLVGPPENGDGAVSVKALDKDVVLCELECL
jgi:hypothetical protein